MAEFGVDTNIFRIFESDSNSTELSNVNWFAEDIEIKTSNDSKGTTVVIDFAYSVEAIISYTVDGINFIAFNEGTAVKGGQSRYIRVQNGSKVNVQANVDGTLLYVIVGEV